MVDVASRYVNAVPLRKVTASAICKHLELFFGTFGVPCQLHTDGASYFVGNIFKDFCKSLGVKHAVGSPYHPQTQGTVERSHQTLKSILKKFALHIETDWDDNLPYVLFVLRDSPSESQFQPL